MTPEDLPDLKDWLNVEIWTIEEAAMLWAAIDPYEYSDARLTEIKSLVHSAQHRKALICQRAIAEAVCAGTLPFSRAFELHLDYDHGEWEKEVEHPDTPDPDKIIPHKTRITQAAFLKWAKSKNIPSYRSMVLSSATNKLKIEAETVSYVDSQKPLQLLAAPTYMDADHPMSPEELRAANDAWHAVTKDGDPRDSGKAIRAAVRKFLDEHPTHSLLSNEAKERICTVVNWNRKGGAPRTPT